jgi:hypothetical protein
LILCRFSFFSCLLFFFWQACAHLLQETLSQLEIMKDEMEKMAEQLRLADR